MNLPSHSPQRVDQSATRELHGLFASEWERTLHDFPIMASELGDRRFNRCWPDLSLANLQRRHRDNERVLERLAQIPVDLLAEEDRLNHLLFRKNYEIAVKEYEFGWHLLPISAREGIQDASTLADALAFESASDYEDWLARLRTFPIYVEQTLALLREGIRSRMLQPKIVMERVPRQIERQLVRVPQESPFYKAFLHFGSGIADGLRANLADEATREIARSVLPSYERLLAFLKSEYLPACPPGVGIWQLPRGKELYEFFVYKYTSPRYSPQEVHQVGLREVGRIRTLMQQIIKEVGFSGSWGEFLEHLRTSPSFYFSTPERLAAAYQEFCAHLDQQLPRLFHRLPKTWYDIRPIPMNIAPDTTTAYYRPPAAGGKRPGTYFINLFRPDVRPSYEIPALSLHEAVPGHHIQIARAMELDELPAFRRFAPEGAFTSYVEGWALYAESLGDELGCYTNPYDKFGQLTYEIWRAARLVVDTGLHAFHWTRDQAIAYFLENTAKVRHDIENEVDRYIGWPGQALAYKIGELEISRLRQVATARLGASFDLRDFHEAVLQSGAVPLDVLEANVERWIEAQARTSRG